MKKNKKHVVLGVTGSIAAYKAGDLVRRLQEKGFVVSVIMTKEAERFVIETALRMGIAPRAEISNPDEAQPYLDMGVKHFCIGTDVSILFEWFKQNGRTMRETLGLPISAVEAALAKPGYAR